MTLNRNMLKRAGLIISWALYDLANQFFALNIISLYFVRWLTLEKRVPEVYYSIAFGVSTFFIALISPILGAVSDISGRRRPFLVWLTLVSIIFTLLLGIGRNVYLALVFFAVANFGCQAATVFYNALMPNIASQERLGFVSGLGRCFAYLGAILALYLLRPDILKGSYQATFFLSGILFLLFALPCMIFVKDSPYLPAINLRGLFSKEKLSEIFTNLKAVAFDDTKFPGLTNFLKGIFFGLCGVNVVILFMSVYATRAFGLNEIQVVNLIAFSTLFAIIGSAFAGFLSDYLGYKLCLNLTFALWAVCFLGGALAKNTYMYFAVGGLAGIGLGAVWAVSRALAIKLVPREKIGEVFGLFNLAGYLSSITGVVFWGAILWFLAPLGEWGYRTALLSLNLFIALGIIYIQRLPKL